MAVPFLKKYIRKGRGSYLEKQGGRETDSFITACSFNISITITSYGYNSLRTCPIARRSYC